MAVFKHQNPFESSFENLSTKVQGATNQIKKSAILTVKAVVSDAKQQITGNESISKSNLLPTRAPTIIEQLGIKQVPMKTQEQIKQDEQNNIASTRDNLQKIEAEIQKMRDQKTKKEQQKDRVEAQEMQQKKVEEKKKKQDPIWKKMLKGSQGSRETGRQASG